MLASRRDVLMASLMALPFALAASAEGDASPVDPAQTAITLPEKIEWRRGQNDGPLESVQNARLFGSTEEPGIYYSLVRWFPGFMSGPHMYDTDRLCVVVSGVWWVNSGADFDPASTVPCPAGTFIRRVAHTPHYDGVKSGGKEPATIAICGIGPVNQKWLDPTAPHLRRV